MLFYRLLWCKATKIFSNLKAIFRYIQKVFSVTTFLFSKLNTPKYNCRYDRGGDEARFYWASFLSAFFESSTFTQHRYSPCLSTQFKTPWHGVELINCLVLFLGCCAINLIGVITPSVQLIKKSCKNNFKVSFNTYLKSPGHLYQWKINNIN